jgi:hypothetical protein
MTIQAWGAIICKKQAWGAIFQPNALTPQAIVLRLFFVT